MIQHLQFTVYTAKKIALTIKQQDVLTVSKGFVMTVMIMAIGSSYGMVTVIHLRYHQSIQIPMMLACTIFWMKSIMSVHLIAKMDLFQNLMKMTMV